MERKLCGRECCLRNMGSVLRLLEGGDLVWSWHASTWWKEVVKLGDYGTNNWFNLAVDRKVGNGLATSFWNDRWRGDKSFRDKYPRLYSVSIQKEAVVEEVREVSELGWEWSFHWRRHLFMWEEELLLSLKEDLEGMAWLQEEDVWKWSLEDTGVFSVNSAYKRLEGLVLNDDRWRVEEKGVFKHLWNIPAPSKVVAFAWKVFHNRVPTKANLVVRNVLPSGDSILCAMCER